MPDPITEGELVTMNTRRRTALAALGVAALAVPTAAIAKPDGEHGHSGEHGGGPTKGVSYVFKGTYVSDGNVDVAKGNAHVRKAELVGTTVQFDLSAAKLNVADTNSDSIVDATDIVSGDNVVVKAKLPKGDPGAAPYAARQLVDQTHPAPESD